MRECLESTTHKHKLRAQIVRARRATQPPRRSPIARLSSRSAGGTRSSVESGLSGPRQTLSRHAPAAVCRRIANRVYAGQRWWVEGHRSHIECLYRRQSRACPTLFIIAVAGGGTADRATGEEAEHWEEAETHNEEAVATTRLNATEGSSRADGGGRRQRTGDG